MMDLLTFLFVALAVVAGIALGMFWRSLFGGKANNSVRVDFDGYKGKEMNERFVSKER